MALRTECHRRAAVNTNEFETVSFGYRDRRKCCLVRSAPMYAEIATRSRNEFEYWHNIGAARRLYASREPLHLTVVHEHVARRVARAYERHHWRCIRAMAASSSILSLPG